MPVWPSRCWRNWMNWIRDLPEQSSKHVSLLKWVCVYLPSYLSTYLLTYRPTYLLTGGISRSFDVFIWLLLTPWWCRIQGKYTSIYLAQPSPSSRFSTYPSIYLSTYLQENRPYIGLMRSPSGGFTVVEAHLDAKTARLTERMTEEAVRIALQAGGLAEPLYIQVSR